MTRQVITYLDGKIVMDSQQGQAWPAKNLITQKLGFLSQTSQHGTTQGQGQAGDIDMIRRACMGSMERCQRVIDTDGSESNLNQIGQLTKFYCFK